MKHLVFLLVALALGAGCQSASAPAAPAAPETTFAPVPTTSAPGPTTVTPAVALGSPSSLAPTVAVPTVRTPIAPAVVSPTIAATVPAATPSATLVPPTQPAAQATSTPAGPNQPAGIPAATAAAAAPPAATPTPWLPQTRQVGQVRVQLLEYVRGQTPDGRPVIRLKAELTNQGDRAAFFADLYFSLQTDEGRKVEPITNVASEERMHQGPLAPGQTTTGFLWYLVAENTRIASVQYDGPTGQTSFSVPE